MELRKASKKVAKLRIGLSGASGFGKTYSALLIAYGITNDWSKIAIIDTENNSADLYSDLGEYSVLPLVAPYSPERYIQAIDVCEKNGIEVVIVDSITHEWDGNGGCLEIVEQISQANSSKNSYFAWAKVTPRHNDFIQKILQSKMHVITTVRRKQDYDMVKNDKGKVEPVKVGTKEITRDGFEYELTVNFELLNANHYVRVSKDRTRLFDGKPEFVPNVETGKQLIEWANTGVDEIKELLISAMFSIENATTEDEINSVWRQYPNLSKNNEFIEAWKIKKTFIIQNK